jgi:hypothetical protein
VQALEDFVWQSSDLLDRLEDLREDLNHNDFADDVPGAKKGSFSSRDPDPRAWSCWIRIPIHLSCRIRIQLFKLLLKV